MIKAIGFDLWETLISDTPELARTQERLRLDRLASILAGCGFDLPRAAVERAYRDLWVRCHELYWSVDVDIPTRRQILHFLEALRIEEREVPAGAIEEMEHAYAIAALEILPVLVPGAEETLAALKSSGFVLGLVSNTGRTPGWTLRKALEALGLSRYLDAMVFSNEHGVCKPQRSIFDELCRNLGVDHGETVFVGDNLYADVHGARQCGMKAIHFEPPQKGLAVARPVDHDLTIVPDATIHRLEELPPIVAGFID